MKRRTTKIRVHDARRAVDDPLRAHLDRRLGLALGGFGDRVAQVVVRMSDADPGEARSIDRCEIEIVLRPRSVNVTDDGGDRFAAIDNATERLKRSVERALERERAWAGATPAPLGAPPAPRRRR